MVTWIETTDDARWVAKPAPKAGATSELGIALTGGKEQEVEGFGGCFNELGWLPLQSLAAEDREQVVKELFSPDELNFRLNRAPIGANDFAAGWYSYDETPGDYELKDFSVEGDERAVLPYIRAAKKYQPQLTVHSSPWSPPTWMKNPPVYNYGKLVMTPENLQAYANYFVKYVRAYRALGVNVTRIFPQNEPWSDAKYPTCKWTSEQLRTFIRDYLGPTFEREGLLGKAEEGGVEIWLGTLNGPRDMQFVSLYGMSLENYNRYVDNILMDDEARKYITGVGYQWEGRDCIERTHKAWPELKLMQTESECGMGDNSWEYAEYIFHLVNHYLTHGALGYTYWNMVLAGTESTWGWHQNSLFSVDTEAKTFTRNPEYYVMRHYAHFVRPGARVLDVEGRFSSMASAYENPDGTLAVVVQNALEREVEFSFADPSNAGRAFTATLAPRSFSTFTLD
ncbi:glycoside hydrolase family 30 protein [Bifidobacterium platyrrhinorum]|uniref:Glycosyl hydrolase n=1 Tax=Bifidobacterium platyrrhinorum TaxID=2661628 RepID=A0A6L9SW32_9BIFI|nr:glycoside hydrolase family 30 protein [Bifidobacterium platyrrhinorum]NEG56063.1 glycosyl hydrolase [Bifidobacterium platyrrhinorum]